jgi:N-acetylneuraminic acid mutarotase
LFSYLIAGMKKGQPSNARKRKIMMSPNPKIILSVTVFMLITIMLSTAQPAVRWKPFPSLPDTEGFAGMYAGVIGEDIFCMGGANFPRQRPWEGGQKVWYDRIFRFHPVKGWIVMDQRLPVSAGYGVTVSYQQEIIMVGGSNASGHLSTVIGMKWEGERLFFRSLPDLPQPLANMAGCLNGSLLMVAGGTASPTGKPEKYCLILDLSKPDDGWVSLPQYPGPGRTQAVAGVYNGVFYLFGGETVPMDSIGMSYRRMLRDAYKFEPRYGAKGWTGVWTRLEDMPRAATAAANPAPLLNGTTFMFWGGVDDVMAAHRDPRTHPGFTQTPLYFDARHERWIVGKKETRFPSRVTLPSVWWRGSWLLISGEIRPGIRTPGIIGLNAKKKTE